VTAMASSAEATTSEAAKRLRERATIASTSVGVILVGVKVLAWLLTGSVSLLSSLLDSLLDVAASGVNLLAVRHAITPADREHRFGHGKAEPLAGLAQAAFIAGSAALLLVQAIQRLYSPVQISHFGFGIGVMVFSIVVTVALVAYQRYVIRRTGSIAISADELHYRSDVILNGSVIVSLVTSEVLGWRYADPLFGAAIAIWILYSSWQITRASLVQLMDRELPDEERARVRAIAEAHPEVKAVHDLKTRAAGPTSFIQLHIEMDPAMTLMRAHRVSDEVEAKLLEAFPTAEIIIHQDPAGVEERRTFPGPKAARA
jgi:ferrous-iron efflux pump FieF